MGVWSDHVWLSGGLATRRPLPRRLDEIAREVIAGVGYRDLSIRCSVQDTVCQEVRDPAEWTAAVNDQAIVIGWAGYDAKTGWLPPEQHLAHTLRHWLLPCGACEQPGCERCETATTCGGVPHCDAFLLVGARPSTWANDLAVAIDLDNCT